jgi:hypothetical protein
MELKQTDQINLLKNCLEYEQTGKIVGSFTYPNCGWDLVKQGLATENRELTIAGRALLWFMGEGPDPTDSKVFQEFKIPLGDT